MAMTNVDEIYLRVIKPLPSAERQRLLTLLTRDLAEDADDESEELDILDLEGLGAEIWEGVDAQEYVNALRAEWESRP